MPPSLYPTRRRGSAHDVLEHLDGLDRHLRVAERRVGVGGAPVTPAIEGDDAVGVAERRADAVEERAAVVEAAVEEQHGRPVAALVLDPRRVPVQVDGTHDHRSTTPPVANPRPEPDASDQQAAAPGRVTPEGLDLERT